MVNTMHPGDVVRVRTLNLQGREIDLFFRLLMLDGEAVLTEQTIKIDGSFKPYGMTTARVGFFNRVARAKYEGCNVVGHVAIRSDEERALAGSPHMSLMRGIQWQWGKEASVSDCQRVLDSTGPRVPAGVILPGRICYVLPRIESHLNPYKHIRQLRASADGFTALDLLHGGNLVQLEHGGKLPVGGLTRLGAKRGWPLFGLGDMPLPS